MLRKMLGRRAENIAVRFLQQNRVQILERNFWCSYGEIDIIAKDRDELVFVEVRSGSGHFVVEPIESITSEKVKHLRKSALFWLYKKHLEESRLRFDIISIIFKHSLKTVEIKYYKDAI